MKNESLDSFSTHLFNPIKVSALKLRHPTARPVLCIGLIGIPLQGEAKMNRQEPIRILITGGTIELDGVNVLELDPCQRARLGIFLAFQYPVTIPGVKVSDFLLLHGNGPDDPSRILKMIQASRAAEGYRPMPVLINEDDHFRFNEAENHMHTALTQYVSWGYFDPGANNYKDGYQCPPVNWGLASDRKKAFFNLLKEVTGA